jgi:hypothetical protein
VDELARSPEAEADAIRASVKVIREKERAIFKRHGFGEYLTFWDADEARVVLFDSKMKMSTEFGEDVWLTGMSKYHDPKMVTFDVDHIVPLQFMPKEHLKAIFMARQVFEPNGGVRVSEFSFEGLEGVKKYCAKVDDVIREETFKLAGQGMKNIFGRMYLEMGGDTITKADRLGRRIKFLADITELYKKDAAKWKPFLVRLKLLGGKIK